ncbi:MAG TPA: hypothetical protein PLU30_00375 [Verrucomicrobiae bacterium]|nr:hypothetical protein [Verrucomicrobiae bacterium]
MDFDPWRWLAIPVWGLILLISPVVGAIWIWQSSGFVPALGIAVGSIVVLRFVFSDRLLQSWHLTAALNGQHVVEPMPVTMVRLRSWEGHEVQLRLKGHKAGGTIFEGDRILATGTWRGGVLRVRLIKCERTGATIIPRQPSAKTLALAGLCVLLAGGAWLSFVGVPWVIGEMGAFRRSIEPRVHAFRQQDRVP